MVRFGRLGSSLVSFSPIWTSNSELDRDPRNLTPDYQIGQSTSHLVKTYPDLTPKTPFKVQVSQFALTYCCFRPNSFSFSLIRSQKLPSSQNFKKYFTENLEQFTQGRVWQKFLSSPGAVPKETFSKYKVVIVSRNFVRAPWTEAELEGEGQELLDRLFLTAVSSPFRRPGKQLIKGKQLFFSFSDETGVNALLEIRSYIIYILRLNIKEFQRYS